MKYKKVIEVLTETYEEEQYILEKFPGIWWQSFGNKIKFYIPIEKEAEVKKVIDKYNEK